MISVKCTTKGQTAQQSDLPFSHTLLSFIPQNLSDLLFEIQWSKLFLLAHNPVIGPGGDEIHHCIEQTEYNIASDCNPQKNVGVE